MKKLLMFLMILMTSHASFATPTASKRLNYSVMVIQSINGGYIVNSGFNSYSFDTLPELKTWLDTQMVSFKSDLDTKLGN